jgi:hypothetical protein
MTVFAILPQDMLMHEINRFLDPVSRANFNAVLKPDERVHKKMPTDFALKHEIMALRQTYTIHVEKINMWLDILEDVPGKEHARGRACAKRVIKFINWIKEPRNAVLVKYKKLMKGRFLRVLGVWRGESEANGGDVWWYDYLPDHKVTRMQVAAMEAYNAIQKLEFVREVKLVGHVEVA